MKEKFFNVRKLLEIVIVLTVTTITAERSFNIVGIEKYTLVNSISEEQINDLILNLEALQNEFKKKNIVMLI